MPRPRKHIPLSELLASALADKLPIKLRDELRERKAPAQQIIRMFTPDHIRLHCWGGEDKWWNLTMRLRGDEIKKKDAADTSRAAKADRIDQDNARHAVAMGGAAVVEATPERRWPKQKIPARPFQKGHRRLQGGNSFRRR